MTFMSPTPQPLFRLRFFRDPQPSRYPVTKRFKVVGINFDHFHMGDLLRMAFDHPAVDIVGVCDPKPERMNDAIAAFGLQPTQVYTGVDALLEQTTPDLAILCPAASRHGHWVDLVAPYGCDILMEKPFAGSLAEADQMIQTAARLIDDGLIGELIEVHYYGGNRGPLWHVADKVERTAEQVQAEKPHSWFYKRDQGGGSLLDYLGYGTTLG